MDVANHSQYWQVKYDLLKSQFEELINLSKVFIKIDDEIHSAPIDEDWAIIKNRAESYTNARRNLLLLIKPIEEAANQQMHSDPK